MSKKIEFTFNEEKTVEAIKYVLNKRPSVNLYNLLKILFEADKSHLNKYGRPVTGDVYIAMDRGTVPSKVYDLYKGAWSKAESDIKITDNYIISTESMYNSKLLSESDLESLDLGAKKYIDLDFKDVQQTNHQEPAWNNTKLNNPIPYELMIEDEELLIDLIDCSDSGLKPII